MRPVPPEPPRGNLATSFSAVPQEVRDEIADTIIAAETLDYSTFRKVTGYILAQLLRGTITTAQADSARRYLELMLTSLVIEMNARAPSGNSGAAVDVIERLKAAEAMSKKIQRTLTIDVKDD